MRGGYVARMGRARAEGRPGQGGSVETSRDCVAMGVSAIRSEVNSEGSRVRIVTKDGVRCGGEVAVGRGGYQPVIFVGCAIVVEVDAR